MLQLSTSDDGFEKIECLYSKYSRYAYCFALKMLGSENHEAAEDLIHEAFIRYYKNPHNYDSTRGPFINWFLAVVRNICLDYLKKKKVVQFISFNNISYTNWEDNLMGEKESLEEEVWLRCQRTEIQVALETISFEQRQAIELAFFKGFSHSQIALRTDQPLGTVKTRIRQGLLKLKEQLVTA